MRKLAKVRKAPEPYKSRTEQRFAQELETWRRAGEIQGWKYEAVKMALGGGAWYTPDFWVIQPDGSVTIYEVKGHWREAARVRIKVAAANFPELLFVAVYWRNKRWEYEEFTP